MAEYVPRRGLGRLYVPPGDEIGAHNKLRRLFGFDTPPDYQRAQELVTRWQPYAGIWNSPGFAES
jgi:3-methyladenine DNA glycosylase/8-oxoguanine DNA glycosylase